MEARGLYREMLTQAWRRGAQLPNDPGTIRRATAASPEEWDRAWRLVAPYWQDRDGLLVNPTQVEIFTEAQAQVVRRQTRASQAAVARWRKP